MATLLKKETGTGILLVNKFTKLSLNKKMWFKELWIRTKEVAVTYTGTFIVVMFLNQLLFFGFCLNPICLIAAMPHCLAITVVIGTLLDRWNKSGKEKEEKEEKEEKTIGTELKEKRSYYLESEMNNSKEMNSLLKAAGIKPEELDEFLK